jgi:hypothetical protein
MALKARTAGAKVREIGALTRSVADRSRKQGKLRLVDPGEPPQAVFVKAVLPDAPVSDQSVVPQGWGLHGEQGLGRLTDPSGNVGSKFWIPVAPSPVLINGRLKDVDDGSESVRVTWVRDGQWQEQTVDRVVVADKRSIVSLASSGMPITSESAKPVVEYLAVYEAWNILNIPKAHVSSHLSWQGSHGDKDFLWGRTLQRPDGSQAADVDVDSLSPEDWREDWIAFKGADIGDEQIADGYRSGGTYAGWLAAIQKVYPFRRVMLALYASLAPPLLEILGAPNFIVDYSFGTSTGKTTLLRIAGSCWGNPDERAPGSVVGTWDSTRVHIERSSAVLNTLPLLLDDTKRSKYEKNISQVLYDCWLSA